MIREDRSAAQLGIQAPAELQDEGILLVNDGDFPTSSIPIYASDSIVKENFLSCGCVNSKDDHSNLYRYLK